MSFFQNTLSLTPTRFISTTVDEVYQAMRNNPGLPDKDGFVHHLNAKLRLKLSLQLDKLEEKDKDQE